MTSRVESRRRSSGTATLIGVVVSVLVGGVAQATTHDVHARNNLTFDPDSLDVVVGDTVRWIADTPNHTVTSGDSLNDPQVGALFDETLLSQGSEYRYRFDSTGRFPYVCRPHYPISGMSGVIIVVDPTGVLDETPHTGTGAGVLPHSPRLLPNHPNPFNGATTIKVELESPMRIALSIHDVLGRQIRTLHEGTLESGRHSLLWDGRDGVGRTVASGLYFARLEAAGHVETHKLVLLK